MKLIGRTLLGALVCAASATHAPWASAQVGPAFGTDAPVPYLYDVHGFDLQAAFDGENTLAVFEDGGAIRGMLIDAAGAPLIGSMLRIDPAEPEGTYYYPSVAYGAERYLVGWGINGVGLQFVDLDGTRMGDPIVLDEDGMYPAIAFNGTNFIVAWMDFTDAGRDIYATAIDPDGNVVGQTKLSTAADVTEPDIAHGETMTIVSWNSNPTTSTGEVHAARVGVQAELVGTEERFGLSDHDYDSNVAAVGDTFLIAWRESANPDVLMTSVWPSGGSPTAPAPMLTTSSSLAPFVGADGSSFVVGYRDAQGVMAARKVTTAGVADATDTPLPAAAVSGEISDLLWVNGRYFFMYVHDLGVVGSYLDANLALDPGYVGLSLVPHPQDSPTVAFDGENYLVMWTDQRDGYQLYSGHAVRVNQQGQVLDASAASIMTAQDGATWFYAASAGAGSTLTAWANSNSGELYTRLLMADGTVTEPALLSAGPARSLSVASNGENYLVSYNDDSTQPDSYTTVGQFLDLAGTPMGDPFPLRTQASYLQGWVRVVGSDYLFSFRDTDNYIATISADGMVSEPQLIAPGSAIVDTVSNGTQTLVAWRIGVETTLHGRMFEGGAFVGDEFVIDPDGQYFSLAWDGTRFVAAWETSASTVMMRGVGTDGALSPVEPLVTDAECISAKVASNGEGQMLLSCYYYGEFSRTRRIANRLIGEPTGPIVDVEQPELPDPDPVDPMNPAPEPETAAEPEAVTDPQPTDPVTDPVGVPVSGPGAEPTMEPSVAAGETDPELDDGTEASNDDEEPSDGAEVDEDDPTSLMKNAGDVQSNDSGGCSVQGASSRSSAWGVALALGLFAWSRRRRNGVALRR